jgi:hypothetical protein
VTPPLRAISDLLLTRDLQAAGGNPRDLRSACARGELVRVRRGAYCSAERWTAFTDRERHLARAYAVVEQADHPVVLAGATAAAVWGMPILGPFPSDVVVLDQYRGGGRSEPGVRRVTTGAPTAATRVVSGMPVTTLARTALDVARTTPFELAVGPVDWTLWRKNPIAITAEELQGECERFAPRAGRRHLDRVVEFATTLSDSFGESRARAVIHELGFAVPVLQLELRDADGPMFADFAWPEVRVLGEFDGELKFTAPRLSGGDPLERLRAQRRREARLRRLGWTIVRLEWGDLGDRARVSGLLQHAGVPWRGQRPGGGSHSSRRDVAAPAARERVGQEAAGRLGT